MVDPINYGALQQQIDLSPLQRGFAMRRDNRAQEAQAQNQQAIRQLAQAKFTAEQEQDAAYRDALTGFSANPTPEALLDMSVRFPTHAQALQDGFKTYTTGQQRDIIGTTVNVLGALQAGNDGLAKKTLMDRSEALRRAGIDTSHTDAAIALIDSGDPVKRKQGIAYMAQVLSGAVGADDAAKILTRFGIGADADKAAADTARADAQFAETQRHNRATEANAAADNARADRADARAARKASGRSSGAKLPSGFVLD